MEGKSGPPGELKDDVATLLNMLCVEERINSFVDSLPYANAARVRRDAQSLARMLNSSLSANMAFYEAQTALFLSFSLSSSTRRSAGTTPMTWLFPLEYPDVDPIVHVICNAGMEFTPNHPNVRASDGRLFSKRAFSRLKSTASVQPAEVTFCCGFPRGNTISPAKRGGSRHGSSSGGGGDLSEIQMVLNILQSTFVKKPPLRREKRVLPAHDAASFSLPLGKFRGVPRSPGGTPSRRTPPPGNFQAVAEVDSAAAQAEARPRNYEVQQRKSPLSTTRTQVLILHESGPLGLELGVDRHAMSLVVVQVKAGGAVAAANVLTHSDRSSSDASKREQLPLEAGDIITAVGTHILPTSFQFIDKDHDGTISLDELKEAFREIGHPMNDEDAQRTFDLYDQDHSGDIDHNEFIQLATDRLLDGTVDVVARAPRPLRLAFVKQHNEDGPAATPPKKVTFTVEKKSIALKRWTPRSVTVKGGDIIVDQLVANYADQRDITVCDEEPSWERWCLGIEVETTITIGTKLQFRAAPSAGLEFTAFVETLIRFGWRLHRVDERVGAEEESYDNASGGSVTGSRVATSMAQLKVDLYSVSLPKLLHSMVGEQQWWRTDAIQRGAFVNALCEEVHPEIGSGTHTEAIANLWTTIAIASGSKGDDAMEINLSSVVSALSVICRASDHATITDIVWAAFPTVGENDDQLPMEEIRHYLHIILAMKMMVGIEHISLSDDEHDENNAKAKAMSNVLVKRTFHEIDQSHNGAISRDEFTKWLGRLRGFAKARRSAEEGSAEEDHISHRIKKARKKRSASIAKMKMRTKTKTKMEEEEEGGTEVEAKEVVVANVEKEEQEEEQEKSEEKAIEVVDLPSFSHASDNTVAGPAAAAVEESTAIIEYGDDDRDGVLRTEEVEPEPGDDDGVHSVTFVSPFTDVRGSPLALPPGCEAVASDTEEAGVDVAAEADAEAEAGVEVEVVAVVARGDVWHAHVSSSTGATYYSHGTTRETTWVLPVGPDIRIVPDGL